MALSASTLKTNLINWATQSQGMSEKQDALQGFVTAYKNYAIQAQDISGDFLLTYSESGMLDVLMSLSPGNTVVQGAQAFEQAIIAFWTGATFQLTTPPPGTVAPEVSAVVTTNIIPGVLASALQSVFADISPDTPLETKMEQLAQVLHSATTTIIVTCIGTNAGPPPPVIPVPGPIW